jgi:hypothetical protein
LAGLVALGGLSGCGAPPEGGDVASVQTQRSALVDTIDGQEWKTFTAINPALSTGTGDPGMCTPWPNGSHSKVVFSRDNATGYIQGIADVVGTLGTWGKYGGTPSLRKLGGRPACGFLAGSSSPYSFVIFARGSNAPNGSADRHLFWSEGTWNATAGSPPPVTSVTQWAALPLLSSNKAGGYNTNGNPAVGVDANGNLVVVYLDDSGQLLANYWTGSGMSGTLTGPALPSGWTGQGTPAISYVGTWVSKFAIFVRATNGAGTAQLYKVFFENGQFVNASDAPNPSYDQVTLPASTPAIQGDPALEWDSNPNDNFFATTLYFRNGTNLYQMSSVDIYFDTSTVKQVVTTGYTMPVSGNQVVIGGVPNEQGRHWIAARGNGSDNNIYFIEANNDPFLTVN